MSTATDTHLAPLLIVGKFISSVVLTETTALHKQLAVGHFAVSFCILVVLILALLGRENNIVEFENLVKSNETYTPIPDINSTTEKHQSNCTRRINCRSSKIKTHSPSKGKSRRTKVTTTSSL